MKEIIDLSLTLGEKYPNTWPGMMPFSHTVFKDFPSEKDPCRTCCFTMDEHCGTHCDAPGHFVKPKDSTEREELSGEHLDLATMQGPLSVIDTRALNGTARPGESPIVHPKMVEAWEQKYHRLETGEIVAFMTGWDRLYYAPIQNRQDYLENPVKNRTTPGWPTPSAETILLLYERGIRCIAIDAPSIGAIHDGVRPHQAGLFHRMIFVEGLTALDKLPPENSYFVFLPLKLEDSSGCPGRAIAYL